MGCAQSTTIIEEPEAKARSDEIDIELDGYRLSAQNELKLLVLGGANSGKSAFIEQVGFIHKGGYNNSERESYKKIIFSNVVQAMRAVLEVIDRRGISLASSNGVHRDTILALDPKIESQTLCQNVVDAIRNLCHDPAIEDTLSNTSQLSRSTIHQFNSVERMSSPAYIPTDEDILYSCTKPTGYTETRFKVGELTYKLFDVSNQNGERRKWIHCFDDVTALMVLVSLSDYNQDSMQESITSFDSMCNSPSFVQTPIILFLTKTDLFAENLHHSPLNERFPDYTGGDNYDAACDFMLHKFVSLNRTPTRRRIYAHYTDSMTDPGQIKFMLSAVQDILLQLYLKACNQS